VLPWYRKKIAKIRRASRLNPILARKVRRLLTDDSISQNKKARTLKQLKKALGTYYGTSPNLYNESSSGFLLRLREEMPWSHVF